MARIGPPGGGGGGALGIQDEGISVGSASVIDFVGADVRAVPGVGKVVVYVPPPAFQSHWNTSDGTGGAKSVSESISRSSARISAPAGGEGNPFKTGGWQDSDRSTSLNTTAVFTTPGKTTGFGGDSVFTVEFRDGDSLVESYTTPALTGNGSHVSPSGNITVNITGYEADGPRWRAQASVTVNVAGFLPSGGRYHAVATHVVDSVTDSGASFVYTQTDVFFDDNPTTPSIGGVVTLVEGTPVLTKHLSGLEYYILNSAFDADVADIDQLNRITARTSGNLRMVGTELGLPTLNHSPFGTGAANFSGWTIVHDQDGVSYAVTDWLITATPYRYIGPSGNITAQPRDTWGSGAAVPTPDLAVLIDTYGASAGATNLFEGFDSEARREDPASFPGAGTWDSEATLQAGEAQVFNSRIMVPSATTFVRSDGANSPNSNWIPYKPNQGGVNPDYTSLVAPVDYGRRFTQGPGNIPSLSFVFSGTFAGGSALADLLSGALEVYVWRVGGLGNVGPPPGNAFPLRVHEPFNFALWDDGATVPGSGIREDSSSGNTVNCTLGTGSPADGGIFCRVVINNPVIKIDSISMTFF